MKYTWKFELAATTVTTCMPHSFALQTTTYVIVNTLHMFHVVCTHRTTCVHVACVHERVLCDSLRKLSENQTTDLSSSFLASLVWKSNTEKTCRVINHDMREWRNFQRISYTDTPHVHLMYENLNPQKKADVRLKLAAALYMMTWLHSFTN